MAVGSSVSNCLAYNLSCVSHRRLFQDLFASLGAAVFLSTGHCLLVPSDPGCEKKKRRSQIRPMSWDLLVLSQPAHRSEAGGLAGVSTTDQFGFHAPGASQDDHHSNRTSGLFAPLRHRTVWKCLTENVRSMFLQRRGLLFNNANGETGRLTASWFSAQASCCKLLLHQ